VLQELLGHLDVIPGEEHARAHRQGTLVHEVLQGLDVLGMAVAEDARPHRTQVVDVLVAIDIPQAAALTPLEEHPVFGNRHRDAEIAVARGVELVELMGQQDALLVLHDSSTLAPR
jgi:hypothetical protein